MSTLIFLNSGDPFTQRKNRHQRKFFKARLEPQQLRLQRIIYTMSLRQNKRDLILEEKRHVLQKINWTIAWDDEVDEDDDLEELSLSEREMVSAFVGFSNNVKGCLTELLYCLDLMRKMLDREMKSKFGSISSIKQETPGCLAEYLLMPEVFNLCSRLLFLANSHSLQPGAELPLCREITSIMKEVTHFKKSCKSLFSRDDALLQSLIEILQDETFDLICHSNVFLILNNCLGFNALNSENFDVVGEQVLRHLHRAVTLYGPEDPLIQIYIKAITLFMSKFVCLVSESTTSSQRTVLEERIATFFTSSISYMTQLIQLNDSDVTVNVLTFVQSMVKVPHGIRIIFNCPSNASIVDFLLGMVSSGHPRSDLSLNILSCMAAGDKDFATSLSCPTFTSSLCPYMHTSSYPIARLLTMFCSLGPVSVVGLLSSVGQLFHSFIEESIYFGEKKTQRQAASLVFAFTKNADPEFISSVVDRDLVDSMVKMCVSPDDPDMTCETFDAFFNLIQRCSIEKRKEFLTETSKSLLPSIEVIYEFADPKVKQSATNLLDFYYYT